MDKQYYVYVMANTTNSVTYTGVTNNLDKGVYEHKEKYARGFTKRYNIIKLVYYEIFQDAGSAITREKQIKAGSRRAKVELVGSMNKEWRDLYGEL
jgi:putative endonuclease